MTITASKLTTKREPFFIEIFMALSSELLLLFWSIRYTTSPSDELHASFTPSATTNYLCYIFNCDTRACDSEQSAFRTTLFLCFLAPCKRTIQQWRVIWLLQKCKQNREVSSLVLLLLLPHISSLLISNPEPFAVPGLTFGDITDIVKGREKFHTFLKSY